MSGGESLCRPFRAGSRGGRLVLGFRFALPQAKVCRAVGAGVAHGNLFVLVAVLSSPHPCSPLTARAGEFPSVT